TRICYSFDATRKTFLPDAVVYPVNSEEVRQAVLLANLHRFPVVPRGAGTGFSGGSLPVRGGVVLSTERMDRIVSIDTENLYAVVEPGVVTGMLKEEVRKKGLFYPPDPASLKFSTLGGNIAECAGGMCAVKYGVTRDYVLELVVVTGTGDIVRLGRRTAKGVVGYDLVGLLVGSEGTLGIVTEITVRLRPLPPPAITVAGYFGSLVEAGAAVRQVAAAGLTPSALELVDRHCLAAVDAWKHMGLSVDADVVLLGRIDEPGAVGEASAERMVEAFREAGASWAERSTDAIEAEALFAARRLAYPALERLGPVLTEDVCVPKARVPEMLGRIEDAARRHDVLIANIAHAGDGNLHPLIITDPGDEPARNRAQAAFAEILDAALALGGTVSGEHGVGLLKKPGLHQELSAEVVALHRAVKQAFDPHGILNPGKVFDA
ncbi:MAG: FAD-binding oxidoreductase, partial [Blastococcus sp.]